MNSNHPHEESLPVRFSSRPALIVLGIVLIAYAIAAAMGLPQAATKLIVEGSHHDAPEGHGPDDHGASHGHADEAATHGPPAPPPIPTVIPFVLLLGAIAVLPLIPATNHWWESNLHRFYVAAGLGAMTLLYYLLGHQEPVARHFLSHIEVHPAASGPSWGVAWTVIQNAMFAEYIPFILLLFSLYTVGGGIRIAGDLPAHPMTNTLFIAAGGLLASFVGTTGAAMILIRPLLATNRERRHVQHTVIFFIFVVCNCGGLLLPIGDPPLFLGYLNGVEFLWTLKLWGPWLFVNGSLLVLYYVWDHFFAYRREKMRDLLKDETEKQPLQFSGLINVFWLLGVVLAVALLDPTKPLPGTDWHPWLYLREIVQLMMVAASLATTRTELRDANNFNYAAIVEVAALFIGIFICMQPALQILDAHGAQLGLSSPQHFFWASGGLSSVLDNAPTYLVFFKTAQSLPVISGVPEMAGVPEPLLVAISLGSVLMGAMTYIGNGPNFMVKAIAEKEGVPMPSFFGYTVYSCLVLLPILVLASVLFL